MSLAWRQVIDHSGKPPFSFLGPFRRKQSRNVSRPIFLRSLSLVVFTLAVVSGTGCSVSERAVSVQDAATEGGAGGNGGSAGTGADASVDHQFDGPITGNTDGPGADGGGSGEGGGCQSGALQCGPTGIPQKCVAGVFVDQALCTVDMPTCEGGA